MTKWIWHEPNHSDYVRGAVESSDFDDLVTFPKSAKPKSKKRRGCPENDYKGHVYIWQSGVSQYSWARESEELFFKAHGFHRRESLTCCGCGKVKKTRYTEEMQKLINKVGWYNAQTMHQV